MFKFDRTIQEKRSQDISIKETTKLYFDYFSNQNIDLLSEMFADDITLKDWSVFASGKQEVLEVIRSIYSEVKHISVIPSSIISCNLTVMAEITIYVDEEIINAVDIIEYEDGKIKAIRAYKN